MGRNRPLTSSGTLAVSVVLAGIRKEITPPQVSHEALFEARWKRPESACHDRGCHVRHGGFVLWRIERSETALTIVFVSRRNDQRFFASLRMTFYGVLEWKAPLPSCYGNENSATRA